MKVRDLLAALNDLTVGSLDKEVYIDVVGDEYREMELVPIVDPDDMDVVIGFVVCEAKPEATLPFDEKKEEVH